MSLIRTMWLCVAVMLLGCQLAGTATEPSIVNANLEVLSISVNDDGKRNINQIVFQFNQAVTIVGAIPSAAQVNTITIENQLTPNCRWRFIDNARLACELDKNLNMASVYHIKVSSFPGLDGAKSNLLSKTIKTPFPDVVIFDEHSPTTPLSSATLAIAKEHTIDPQQIARYLAVKTPKGEYFPLGVQTAKSTYQNAVYKLIPSEIENRFSLDGQYQVVLKTGFNLDNGGYSLSQDLVLYSFEHYQQFTWLGFGCALESEDFEDHFVAVKVASDGLLNCDPKRVVLKFSHPIKDAGERDLFPGLTGVGSHEIWSFNSGYFGYIVALAGETKHQFDLNLVQSLGGQTPANAQVLEFVTAADIPYWGLEKALPVVVAQSDETPLIGSINVKSLSSAVTVIRTPEQLLLHLNSPNNKLNSPVLSNNWPLAYKPSEQVKTPVPLRHLLGHTSGLLSYTLTDGKKSIERQLNSAAFNINYWINDDWLIELTDWHNNKAIEGADISLLCAGTKVPQLLGKTSALGILLIDKSRWQQVDRGEQECWFWAQKAEYSSAIAYDFTQYQQAMVGHLWTAQPVYRPGETIKFGFVGRRRSNQGMVAVKTLADFDLYLTDSRYSDQPLTNIKVVMSAPSRFGFAKGELKTSSQMLPGTYYFYLVPKNAVRPEYQRQFIGEVELYEYIPSEFEATVNVKEVLFKGDNLTAKIQAKRLNGQPLKQARVEIEQLIRSRMSFPNHWPKDYTYSSHYSSNYLSDNAIVEFEPVSHKQTLYLDDNGELDFDGQLFDYDLPIGVVDFNVTITATDGEVQSRRSLITYLGREHYIGTRVLPALDKQGKHQKQGAQVEVIAVDNEGHELTDIPVLLAFYQLPLGDEKLMLGQCSLSNLPGSCQIPFVKDDVVELLLTSGQKDYQWQRILMTDFHTPDITPKDRIKFQEHDTKIVAGKVAKVELHSPSAGTLRLVVQTDKIKKTWLQPVAKGNNEISFATEANWGPQFSLHALLKRPVKDEQIQPYLEALHDVHIVSDMSALNVQIKVQQKAPQKTIVSGQTISLTLQSNQNADSQIWLVNDALWQQNDVKVSDFDLYEQLLNGGRSVGWHWGRTGFETLTTQLIARGPYEVKQKMMLNMYSNNDGLSKPRPLTSANASNASIFAESVWLDLVSLKALKPQTVEIKLPQLIGRWRLLVVSANNKQFDINDKAIETTQPIEYFLDAPTTMLSVDTTKLGLLAINTLAKSVQPEVMLWIDGKRWRTETLSLAAGQQKQWAFELPQLAQGEHTIHLTQTGNPDYLAQSVIEIKTAVKAQQLTWHYQPRDRPERILSADFVPGSLQLKSSPAKRLTPDWLGLSDYNQNYTHQCWEQNVSRALSYAYNPISNTRWPQGQSKLDALLGRASQYQLIRGMFSYFSHEKSDSFLTAYSYLVQFWLGQKPGFFVADIASRKTAVLAVVKDDDSVLNRSMALLALSVNGDIDLDETLLLRQKIGRGSAYAQSLQIMALKQVNANERLIQSAQNELLATGYQDLGLSILNDNAKRCFTVLALGDTHPRSQPIMAQVLKSQRAQRHFGSTFANGVCSYLFTNRLPTKSHSQALDFTVDQQHLKITNKPDVTSYLQLDYLQDYRKMETQMNGISIHRVYSVKNKQENVAQWRPIKAGDRLFLGDVVKVELIVDSPVSKEHLAVIDYLPGAFEVVNNRFSFQFEDSEHGVYAPNLQIKKGRVNIYPHRIEQGETVFRYYAKVRSQGRFLAPGPEAQMMYQPSVWARGAFEWVRVTGYDQ